VASAIFSRGVKYVYGMMRKCIKVKVGKPNKTNKNKNTKWWKFINLAEIGGICNTHNWFMGMDAPDIQLQYSVIALSIWPFVNGKANHR